MGTLMRRSLLIATACVASAFACSGRAAPGGPITPGDQTPCTKETVVVPDLPGWKLAWHDEFETDGLPDSRYWGYDTGNSGFGNHEAETYYADFPETARVECGRLVVTTSRVNANGRVEYRSARLKTQNKVSWKYGRIEIRAKLPAGRGTWPAIWMLPQSSVYGGWPKSGEIDIMEHVGFDPNVIHGTVHTESFNHTLGTQKGSQINVPSALTGFNVYAIEWDDRHIDFFVGDTKYFTFDNNGSGSAAWPFDQPFFLLINTAVGGDWGGQQGIDDTVFPQEFVVDYVRVYQR